LGEKCIQVRRRLTRADVLYTDRYRVQNIASC
jgi:hypothetical protein